MSSIPSATSFKSPPAIAIMIFLNDIVDLPACKPLSLNTIKLEQTSSIVYPSNSPVPEQLPKYVANVPTSSVESLQAFVKTSTTLLVLATVVAVSSLANPNEFNIFVV